ncbi:hypothetical protein [Thalassospira lohafexi]|uniref:Uncharacterized protein n=1 Tax=Thalassospira lohafexi TaxID=744227 RepID=A0A2N3L3T9_9PROT|nr:hypothetical protein [Thalassospira lohafexi]PKR57492.1 hypothetical protein COO92_16250 [Thalassospira lohafexi]
MKGFVAGQRSRFEHPLFRATKTRPYCRGYAWDWIVAHAIWSPDGYDDDVGGRVVKLARGQLSYSIRFMAEKWGWSRTATERFIKRLETETMIRTATGTGQLVITVCNYDKYQAEQEESGTATGTATGTAAGQQRDSSGTKNNKDNKDNTDQGHQAGSVFNPSAAFEACQKMLDDHGYDRGRFEVSAGSYEAMINLLRDGVPVHALSAAAGSVPANRAADITMPPSYIAKIFRENRDRFMAIPPPDPGMAAYGKAVAQWQADGRQGQMPRIEDYTTIRKAANDG